jgi:hypothetical protein
MFAETRWGLAMSMLGIAAVIFGFGLSEALAASDVWKGSWKFEIERQRAIPYLTYYDTSGKPVFRIACGMHFEIDAVYPGASPKQDTTGVHRRVDALHDPRLQEVESMIGHRSAP